MRAAMAVGAVITAFVLTTDAIFSVIVTYIFLKPVLKVLQAAGGRVETSTSRRLERALHWNFAGVLVTVGSSTVFYVNFIAYLVQSFLLDHSLSSSVWGNPFTFGLAVNSILNTLGMVLLCGMFKDASFPRRLTSSAKKVAPGALEEQNGESGFIINSHVHSSSTEIVATPPPTATRIPVQSYLAAATST